MQGILFPWHNKRKLLFLTFFRFGPKYQYATAMMMAHSSMMQQNTMPAISAWVSVEPDDVAEAVTGCVITGAEEK